MSLAELERTAAAAGAADLFARSVCMDVTLRKPGTKKRVEPAEVAADLDPEYVSVHKVLLRCQELDDIARLDRQIRSYLYSVSVPSPLKTGVYLIPLTLLGEVEERLDDVFNERRRLVEKFLGGYPGNVVAEVRKRPGRLFVREELPKKEALRNAFKAERSIFTLAVPEALQNVSPVLYQRVKDDLADSMRQTMDEIRVALRQEFQKLVQRLHDSLEPREDGSRKPFHRTTLAHIDDFLRTFEHRDLVGLDELAGLVREARELLGTLGAPDSAVRTIKSDEGVRKKVLQGSEGILRAIELDSAPKEGRA